MLTPFIISAAAPFGKGAKSPAPGQGSGGEVWCACKTRLSASKELRFFLDSAAGVGAAGAIRERPAFANLAADHTGAAGADCLAICRAEPKIPGAAGEEPAFEGLAADHTGAAGADCLAICRAEPKIPGAAGEEPAFEGLAADHAGDAGAGWTSGCSAPDSLAICWARISANCCLYD